MAKRQILHPKCPQLSPSLLGEHDGTGRFTGITSGHSAMALIRLARQSHMVGVRSAVCANSH